MNVVKRVKKFPAVMDRFVWIKTNPNAVPGVPGRSSSRENVKKSKTPIYENNIQKMVFHFTSVLTAWFPQGGARFLDGFLQPLLGHRILVKGFFWKNRRILKGLKRIKKILVISDIHIGDAVMMQGAVRAFRDFFPDAQIDYVIKKSIGGLIEGNPAITRIHPCYTGTVFPTSGDIESVQKLIAENRYDLCFNGSSLFQDSWLVSKNQVILNFMTVAPLLIRNEMDRAGNNHFLYQSYAFTENLLRSVGFSSGAQPFKGVPVTLSDEAVQKARDFLKENDVPKDKTILFLNPDTASPYTLIPPEYQIRILKEWLKMDSVVILGASFTHPDMGEKLLDALSWEERGRVFATAPSLPIEAYAALIDSADVFLSGDTGPLHIAAARKVSRSGRFEFRNKTFVISVFGATPSRMSGYDSVDPLYLPADQDAPSRTYVSGSPCRNITCVNKLVKTCKTVRCFEALDIESIMTDIRVHLRNRTARFPLAAS
jgi:ADP-heptose:LPS heptosyltransferase